MKTIDQLNFGYSDAVNYRNRNKKEVFNKIFIKTDSLDKICEDTTSFIVGEKGTGKTAYAVYMANNEINNTSADIKYVKETDYAEFIFLKEQHHLSLSNYTVIWKVILFMILSDNIINKENNFISSFFNKFNALKKATEEYNNQAFSPEVTTAFEFLTNSNVAAELITKNLNLEARAGNQIKNNSTRFQTNLTFIKRNFEEAFTQLKLKKNHLIFIDGIDFRPSGISYESYLECIKGLANAIWDLNTSFFPNIKDSPGRCRVVLLTRPDIFDSLSLQNSNAKLQDNSVLLNWHTDYKHHRKSNIFQVTEKILSSQNNQELDSKFSTYWDYYFPWNATNVDYYTDNTIDYYSSFIAFLRWSYHKPRDILTMLDFLQRNTLSHKEHFSFNDFQHQPFIRDYSNYLLGEVKDQLSFYYESQDYELFLKFFQFLNGNYRFSYQEYLVAFEKATEYIGSTNQSSPQFMSTANDFLQFLYQLNIICYIDKPLDEYKNTNVVAHWCFRERNSANISPKIKIGADIYEVFYGLRKSLNVEIRTKS